MAAPIPAPQPASGSFLERISQIAVVVHDPERALAFYRDILELRLLFQAPPSLAFFDCGGVRLMLSPPEGTDAAASSVLYYKVSDIHAAQEVLRGRGVEFDQEPHIVAKLPDRDVWLAHFRDSEANLLALMAEVPRAV
jgi:methylmalonyl-CoA/ethylmalonyl-CoA epimerase